MMKFKRITAFLLILCMVMIGGCSQEEAVDPVKTAGQTAENYLFNKDYKNAAKAYEAMGGYGDAPLYTVYCLAMQALEDGKYESAYLSFDMLGDFLDSRFASVYAKALFNTESAKKEPECYLHAAEFFDSIPLYRDSAVRAENARLSLYKEAEKCLNAGEYELSAHYFALLEDYSDSAQMEKYVYAREYEAAGTENLEKYLYSVNRYEKLNGFKDSKARAKAVLENSYAFGTEKFELGDYTDAANVFLCLTKNGKILEETYSDSAEMHDYANAHFALEKSGDDIEKMLSAAVGFDQMKGFKKSAEKAEEIRLNVYTIGETALENGEYETAQACFEAQKDYKDSKEMVGYTLARAFEAENAGTDDGKISAAITYEKLNGFRDSGDRAEKMRGEIYKKAENALENGEYENAETLFAMQDYKDSKNMAQYAKAVGAEAKSGKNDVKKIDAAKEFEKLGDFKDSAKRAAALREDVYQKAEKAFSNRNYLNAIRLYTIQDYKDSKTMVDYARAASLEFEGKHADAAEEFEKLGEFRDSAEKAASLRQGIYDRAVKALNSGKYENAIELFASQDYLDSKDMIVYTENMIIYDGAAAYAAKGMPVKAAEAYESLGEFKDSAEKAASIRKDIYDRAVKALEEGKYDESAKLFASQNYEDSKEMISYVNAAKLLSEGKNTEAATAYEAMGEFKDSAEKAASIRKDIYDRAVKALEEGKYDESEKLFASQDYEDSEEMISYVNAAKFLSEGKNTEAASAYEAMGEFRDSAEKAASIRKDIYDRAVKALEDGKYDESAKLFASQDYEDSEEMISYVNAAKLLSEGKNTEAATAYEAMGEFRDSAEKAASIRKDIYDRAVKALEEGKYDESAKLFASQDYEDSEEMISYVNAAKLLSEGKNTEAASAYEAMGEFKDSAEKAASIRKDIYDRAVKALEEEKYDESAKLFASQDYEDSKEMISYVNAAKLLSEGKNTEAATAYEALGEFKDSAEKAASIRKDIYDRAMSALANGEYDNAAKLFSSQDYLDSKSMIPYVNAAKLLSEGKNTEAAAAYEAISEFRDSEEKAASIRKDIYDRAMAALENGKYDDSAKLFASQDYLDSETMISYVNAAKLFSEGKNYEAAAAYEAISEFRDSEEKAASIRKDIYDRAMAALENGEYDNAAKLFASQNYLDSKNMISYVNAAKLLSEGKNTEAAKAYEAISEFRDSEEKAASIRKDIYDRAMSALANGKYDDAAKLFSSQDYLDSKSMIPYVNAAKLLSEGKNTDAAAAYEAISEFKDSKEKAASIRKDIYDRAMAALENGEYDNAAKLFSSQDYLDSETMVSYVKAVKLGKEGDGIGAAKAFEALGEFRDSAEQAADLRSGIYFNGLALFESGKYQEAKEIFKLQPEYEDCANLCTYIDGALYAQKEDYLNAAKKFKEIEGFKDAVEHLNFNLENAYKKAWAFSDNKEYKKAESIFAELGEYSDSKQAKMYVNALGMMKNAGAEAESYVSAKATFTHLDGYKDSAKHIKEIDKLLFMRFVDEIGVFSENGLASFKKNGKWGFIDTDGNVVVSAQYDQVYAYTEGLAAVKLAGSWGFIDEKGAMVISNKYASVRPFSSGMAWVNKDSSSYYYFIDQTGKESEISYQMYYSSIPNDFDGNFASYVYGNNKYYSIDKSGKTVSNSKLFFSEGISAISTYKSYTYTYGYMNENGNIISRIQWQEAKPFNNGFAVVKKDDKYGLIDKTGNLVIDCKYSSVNSPKNGICLVSLNGKYGYVSVKGTTVSPVQWTYAYDYVDGLALVWKDGYYGYIGTDGQTKIAFTWDEASSFEDGYACVKQYGAWKFIDTKGNIVMTMDKSVTEVAGKYIDPLILVKNSSGKYGYCAKDGKMATGFSYDQAYDFSCGLARVKKGSYYGFIDETGKEAIPAKYYFAMDFSDDIALVQNGSYYSADYAYIDKNMKVIYQTDTYYKSDVFSFVNGTAFVRRQDGDLFFLIDKNGKVLTDAIFTNITESNISEDAVGEEMYYYMLEMGEIAEGAVEEFDGYAYADIPSLTKSGVFPSNTKFKISRTGEILAFDGHETSPVYAKKINGAWYLTNFEGDILV